MEPCSFKANIDLNHRIDQRIAMHERDQQRREAWKRHACQHHVERAGVCTGQIGCPCPNCREFYRLRSGESLHTVHIGHDDRGQVVKWIWVRYAGLGGRGWRRKNIATRQFFGPLVRHIDPSQEGVVHHIRTRTVGAASIKDEMIIHVDNPNSADNWVRAMFTDPPASTSLDQAMETARARVAADMRWDAYTPPKTTAPEQAKEHPVLTALQLAILSHHIVHLGVPYPYTCSPGFGNVGEAFAKLIAEEFLEPRPEGGYKITHRTTVYFRAINALPLPVRKQTPWVMPEPQPQTQFGSRER